MTIRISRRISRSRPARGGFDGVADLALLPAARLSPGTLLLAIDMAAPPGARSRRVSAARLARAFREMAGALAIADVAGLEEALAGKASLPEGNGLIARTGATATAARTLTAGAGILLSNPAGVHGDPEIAVDIERGSTPDGDYVRFPDGTQICTRTVTIEPVQAVQTFDFPMPFFGTSGVHAVGLGGGPGGSRPTGGSGFAPRMRAAIYTVVGFNAADAWQVMCWPDQFEESGTLAAYTATLFAVGVWR